MGWKLRKVDVKKLKPNEEKDISVKLMKESKAAIHGEVKFCNGKPVKGAVVKLFKKVKSAGKYELVPVTFTFTDKFGQFLFGVKSGVHYVIKVFFYKPEKPCDKKDDKDKHDKKDKHDHKDMDKHEDKKHDKKHKY